jgi:hypothetical protein
MLAVFHMLAAALGAVAQEDQIGQFVAGFVALGQLAQVGLIVLAQSRLRQQLGEGIAIKGRRRHKLCLAGGTAGCALRHFFATVLAKHGCSSVALRQTRLRVNLLATRWQKPA